MTDRLVRRKNWHFSTIENSIIDCIALSVYEKMAYITLCRYAGDKDSCFPSYEALASKIGCSKRKAIYVVQELVDKGLITKQSRRDKRGGNISNIYIINDPDEFDPDEFLNSHAPSAPHADGGLFDADDQLGAPDAQREVHDVHPIGARHAPKEESFNNNHLEEESVSQSIIDNTILDSIEENNGNSDKGTDGQTDDPLDVITSLMEKYGLSEEDMEICLAKLEGREIRNPIGFLRAVVKNYIQEKKILESSRASPFDGSFRTREGGFVPPRNHFNSYNQRKYDVKELEQRLLKRSYGEEDDP